MIFGLSREAQVALIFAALVAAQGCAGGGGDAGSGGRDSGLADTGWGNADVYPSTPIELVDEAADRRIRWIVDEVYPSVQAANWRKGQLPRSFDDILAERNRRICRNGGLHLVFFWNWNMPPIREQADSWAIAEVERILPMLEPACTLVEATVEPDKHNAKAQRWTELLVARWPGRVVIPAAGAHWPIRRDFVDYHPGSVGEARLRIANAGPGTLIVTDGGPFAHPPDVLDELGELTSLALARGVPLVHYTDRYAPGDVAAHRAVIDAIAAGIP